MFLTARRARSTTVGATSTSGSAIATLSMRLHGGYVVSLGGRERFDHGYLTRVSVSTKGSGDNGGRILMFRSLAWKVRYILLDDFAVFVMKDELKMIQS